MVDDVAPSQLAVNALSTLNLGSILSDIISMKGDEEQSLDQVNRLLDETNKLVKNAQDFTVWCNKPPEEIIKACPLKISQPMNTIYQWQRLGNLAQKGGYSVTNSIFKQRINAIFQNTHVNAWSKIYFDLPEGYLIKQADKWWKRAFAIEDLPETQMLIAYANNYVDSAYVVDYYRENMGLTKEDAQQLFRQRYMQFGLPSISELFRLVCRGKWTEKDFLNVLTVGHGYTIDDAKAVFDMYHYQFGVSEIMNLSALLPLDEKWIDQKLTEAGVKDVDKPIFKAVIQKRTTRDEVRQLWSALLSQYVNGYYTDGQLTTLLKNWGFLQSEIEIKILVAKELKAKNCLSMTRDAQIYLFRQGAYSANDLFTALTSIGIDYLVSNAIVVQEAAKKGEIWENPNPV